MPKWKYVGPEPIDLPTLDRSNVQPGDEIDAADGSGLEANGWFEPLGHPLKKSKAAEAPAEADANGDPA